MLSDCQKRIMIRAIIKRLDDGEELDVIINSYSKLTEDDKSEIVATIIEIK